MKFFKDFIYDKNDIVIALLILAIAGLLIAWRMDAIMTYPQTLAEETGPTKTAVEDLNPADEPAGDTDDRDTDEDSDDASQSSDGIWSGEALAQDVTVTIERGAASIAVQSLVDAGLFDSYDEFEHICNTIGTEPTNIKATTFTFGAGATKADIAKTVTS